MASYDLCYSIEMKNPPAPASTSPASPGGKPAKDGKKQRMAEALRKNLRRRKTAERPADGQGS